MNGNGNGNGNGDEKSIVEGGAAATSPPPQPLTPSTTSVVSPGVSIQSSGKTCVCVFFYVYFYKWFATIFCFAYLTGQS